MRLTVPLRFPRKGQWEDSWAWHRFRNRGVAKTQVAAKLQAEGFVVEDANEFVKKDSPLFLDLDAIPTAKPIFPAPPKLDRSNPDWHDVPCKIFDSDSLCIEAVPQAQVFTKSVLFKKGLPEKVLEIGHSTTINHQDLLVQRIIKQAYIWDAYLEKLPKLRHLEIPQFKFQREYGIPLKRRNEIIFRNFLRLCETQFPSIAVTRALTDEEFKVNLTRHGGLVQFKLSPMFTIMSKALLKVDVVRQEEVAEKELPNLYPFLSNVGIDDHNVYTEKDRLAVKPDSPFPYMQTALFSHHIPGSHTHAHPRWTDSRFAGTTVMYNFATALLMARRKFGHDIKGTLPEPITTQVIHLTGQEFQFSVLQLHTLDLEENSNSLVKNILWLTPKIQLFKTCQYEHGIEQFEGYNPEAFKLFMGMYAHGSLS